MIKSVNYSTQQKNATSCLKIYAIRSVRLWTITRKPIIGMPAGVAVDIAQDYATKNV